MLYVLLAQKMSFLQEYHNAIIAEISELLFLFDHAHTFLHVLGLPTQRKVQQQLNSDLTNNFKDEVKM